MSRPFVLHHCWRHPETSNGTILTDHELWAVENFMPIARVRCDVASDVPPGGTNVALTPEGTADAIHQWVSYYTTIKANHSATYEHYSIFVQNWGDPHASNPTIERTNTFALCRNWADRVTVVAPITNAKAVQTPYWEQGATLLRDWTIDFVEELSSLLVADSLPQPYDWHWDWESGFTVATGAWVPISEGGIADAVLADARATTEQVVGTSTYDDLYSAGVQSDGVTPVAYVPTAFAYESANREWRVWAGATHATINSAALRSALYDVIDAKFPDAGYSNYFYAAFDESNPPPPDKANDPVAFVSFDNSDATFGTILAYPFNNDQFTAGSGLSVWMSRYGVISSGNTTTDLANLWWAVTTTKIRNARAAGNNQPIAIWMPTPGRTSAELTNIGAGVYHTVTGEQLRQLAAYAMYGQQVRDFLWFTGTGFTDYDGLYETISDINENAATLEAEFAADPMTGGGMAQVSRFFRSSSAGAGTGASWADAAPLLVDYGSGLEINRYITGHGTGDPAAGIHNYTNNSLDAYIDVGDTYGTLAVVLAFGTSAGTSPSVRKPCRLIGVRRSGTDTSFETYSDWAAPRRQNGKGVFDSSYQAIIPVSSSIAFNTTALAHVHLVNLRIDGNRNATIVTLGQDAVCRGLTVTNAGNGTSATCITVSGRSTQLMDVDLYATGDFGSLLTISAADTHVRRLVGIGAGATSGSNNGIGIYISTASQCSLDDITLCRLRGRGIEIQAGTNSYFSITNLTLIDTGDDGIYVGTGTSTYALDVVRAFIVKTGQRSGTFYGVNAVATTNGVNVSESILSDNDTGAFNNFADMPTGAGNIITGAAITNIPGYSSSGSILDLNFTITGGPAVSANGNRAGSLLSSSGGGASGRVERVSRV